MADPIHQFQVTPIIPLEIGGIDVSFTNSSLWMVIGIFVSTTVLSMAMGKRSIVPGRLQVLAEGLYEFIAGMIRENIGSKGRQYFPLIFTLFMVVLMGNLLGMLPYAFTYTSHIIVTGILALIIFFVVMIIGIYNHGFRFFSLFVPPGVSIFMLPLIVPIEIISFLVRPLTLSVRLFANMMAGHLVLKVFAGFSVAMLSIGAAHEGGIGGVGVIASIIPMLFNSILIAFEILIALLHAYVFAVLSCIYLKDTVELHH